MYPAPAAFNPVSPISAASAATAATPSFAELEADENSTTQSNFSDKTDWSLSLRAGSFVRSTGDARTELCAATTRLLICVAAAATREGVLADGGCPKATNRAISVSTMENSCESFVLSGQTDDVT